MNELAAELTQELGGELHPRELYPAGVIFRRSLTPEIREPHECTTITNVQQGCHVHEYGWVTAAG